MTIRSVALGALVCAIAGAPSSGATARWINAAGGSYQSGANWSTAGAPGSADDLVFDLPETYSVFLDADASAATMLVEAGDVTLDTQGNSLSLATTLSLIPGAGSTTLTVRGGGSVTASGYQSFHDLDAFLNLRDEGTSFTTALSFISLSDVFVQSGASLTTGRFVIDGRGQNGQVGATISGVGASLSAGPIDVVDEAEFNVARGAVAAGGSLDATSSAVEISNAGSRLDLAFNASFRQGSLLRMTDGASLSGPAINLSDGAGPTNTLQIAGDATITGPVALGSNSRLLLRESLGAAANPGRLEVDGAFMLSSAAETIAQIDGLAPEDYSSVHATGDLLLGGALQVAFAGAIPLELGDAFTLFTTDGSLTGEFSEISLPSLGALGYSWSIEQSDSAFSLRVVPAPGGVTLLGVAAIGVPRRRRRTTG